MPFQSYTQRIWRWEPCRLSSCLHSLDGFGPGKTFSFVNVLNVRVFNSAWMIPGLQWKVMMPLKFRGSLAHWSLLVVQNLTRLIFHCRRKYPLGAFFPAQSVYCVWNKSGCKSTRVGSFQKKHSKEFACLICDHEDTWFNMLETTNH